MTIRVKTSVMRTGQEKKRSMTIIVKVIEAGVSQLGIIQLVISKGTEKVTRLDEEV